MTGDDPCTTAATSDERAALDPLGRDECVRLMASVPVGRVAVGRPGQAPFVAPVNFGLDGDIVVFRTDLGDKLQGLRNGHVTFQVDAFDPFHRTGWSVLVNGVAETATSDQVERVDVRPWAPGPKSWWIQLRPALITGRRLRLVDSPGDDRGYL
jgi:nitroimidazol reductase NimA-like FMN-containing flavoprotein (pyridoxamine 5'-phosphate oxidase superfamily)